MRERREEWAADSGRAEGDLYIDLTSLHPNYVRAVDSRLEENALFREKHLHSDEGEGGNKTLSDVYSSTLTKAAFLKIVTSSADVTAVARPRSRR